MTNTAPATTLRAEWNTGRMYAADGQRVIAELLADGSAVFADTSRGIIGHVDFVTATTPAELRREVMQAYDLNQYRGDAAAHAFHGRLCRELRAAK